MAKKRKKKKKKNGLLLTIVVLCIVGLVSYFAAMKLLGNNNSSSNNRKSPEIKDVTQAPPGNEGKEDNNEQGEEKKPEKKPGDENNDEKKDDEVKEDQPPEETVKPDSSFAEEVVNNFSVLYPITVNSGRTIDVLEDDIIIKDSDFYNEIKKQLESYKKDGISIQYTNFLIQDVNYLGNNEFDITVSQELVENKGGKSTTKNQTVVYRVLSSQDSIGIKKATVK